MIVQYLRSEKLFMAAVVIQDEANMKTSEQQVRALFTSCCCCCARGALLPCRRRRRSRRGRSGRVGGRAGARGSRRAPRCRRLYVVRPLLPFPSRWKWRLKRAGTSVRDAGRHAVQAGAAAYPSPPCGAPLRSPLAEGSVGRSFDRSIRAGNPRGVQIARQKVLLQTLSKRVRG